MSPKLDRREDQGPEAASRKVHVAALKRPIQASPLPFRGPQTKPGVSLQTARPQLPDRKPDPRPRRAPS